MCKNSHQRKHLNRLLAWVMSLLMLCSSVSPTLAQPISQSDTTVTDVTATETTATDIQASTVSPSAISVGTSAEPTSDKTDEDLIPMKVWSDSAEPEEIWVTRAEYEAIKNANKSSRRRAAARSSVPSYAEVQEQLLAKRTEYPEGMSWTNFDPYGNNGSLGKYYIFQGGFIADTRLHVGCSAYVCKLSDDIFGSLPARVSYEVHFEDVQIGDILRVNGGTHSVIVTHKGTAGIIVTEANYNKSVHWGRTISKAEVEMASFMVTRYPVGYSEDSTADDVAYRGTESNGFTWTLTNNGVLTITGTGDMTDYSISDLGLVPRGSAP